MGVSAAFLPGSLRLPRFASHGFGIQSAADNTTRPIMDPLSFLGGALLGASTWPLARRLASSGVPREGLGDLLGWAFLVDEGVILMKDGTFVAGMTLRGRDLESASKEEVNQAASAVHEAIALLGEGYALEVNVHRRERREYPSLDECHFPTPALRAVEMERRYQFLQPKEHYETTNTVLLGYTPPKDHVRRWERLVVSGSRSHLDYRHVLERFKGTLQEVRDHLSATFLVTALDSQGLLTECHRCLTGRSEPVAPQACYLSHALASADFATGYLPRMGRQHAFVLTITSLGSYTEAAAGDFFNSLREEARWHMRLVALSRSEALRRIRKLQHRWFHQRGGLRAFAAYEVSGAIEDQDAVEMQRETAHALAEASSGKARFGYFTNSIILRDTSAQRGRARAQALLQTLRDQGFTAMQEDINATDAFIGSLPGHGYANLRRPLLSSRNIAHLFPVTTPWPGERTCPSALFPKGSVPLLYARACGATPFCLNLHQGDVGHTLVVGATGAGKSVLVGFVTLSFLRYAKSRAFVFDIGGSHQVLTFAAQGTHHALGTGIMPALQPLRHLDSDEDLMWAQSWLETIFALARVALTPADRQGVSNALRLLAERVADQRTLTALYVCLPHHLQDAMAPYTVQGAYGRLLDGTAGDITASRLTTIELQSVLPLGDTIVVPLLMTLFRQIERSLDGAPTLIVIEEAWAALLRSTFSARIRQWLLTLRKHNAAVVLVAHSAGQLRALPNASCITESCPTRILLPNPEARVAEHAEVYRFLDLGSREIDIIASAQRRRDYYYKSPSGSRLFELNLGPKARALLMPLPGRSAQASLRAMTALMDQCGPDFLDHLDMLHS